MKTYKRITDKYAAPCAHYLFAPLFLMEGTLTNAMANIANRVPEFDTIVCSGISGIIFGVPLAQRMGRKVAIVRKPGDGTHSNKAVEANCLPDEIGNYIIVDDLIDTGATKERIIKAMVGHSPSSKHVATYLYSYDELSFPSKD